MEESLELLVKTKQTKYSFLDDYNTIPAGIHLLKVTKRDTRTRCKIYSKLTITTLKRRHCRRSGVFIVNFEHIPHLFLVLLLLTLNK